MLKTVTKTMGFRPDPVATVLGRDVAQIVYRIAVSLLKADVNAEYHRTYFMDNLSVIVTRKTNRIAFNWRRNNVNVGIYRNGKLTDQLLPPNYFVGLLDH